MQENKVNFIYPKNVPPVECSELCQRIDGISLPKTRHVILVAEDMTRPDHMVSTLVLERLIQQCGRDNITLVIGNGMHRAPSRAEVMKKFGWNVQWVRTFYNNPMCDREWLAELKKKEDAYVISLSSTFSHMHVGMSGGDKVVIPGCAHWCTVRHFHASKRQHARRVMREIGASIIDYYICMVLDYRCACLDIFCGGNAHNLDEFRNRAKEYYKVEIPEELPDAVLMEPTIKTFDFEQCMNVFNIVRSSETDKQLVKRGGVIGIKAEPVDGMGIHYMFQAMNGIAPVYFDEVFAKELKDRHIVFISSNLAENAIQDFFKTKVMVFENVGGFHSFIEAKFTVYRECEITYPTVNHYISPETMRLLTAYPWPGNVREMENTIERAVALAAHDIIFPDDLPKNIHYPLNKQQPEITYDLEKGVNLEKIMDGLEKQLLFQALDKSKGNKTQAAEFLNLSFRSFRYRLKKYWDQV